MVRVVVSASYFQVTLLLPSVALQSPFVSFAAHVTVGSRLNVNELQEAFGLKSINDLPLSFDIAWYEQKAVAVLLALLALGVKGIRLGPTLPAFLSPNVAAVLVKNFDIKPTGQVAEDVAAIMAGK